ncbi:hypothetical protein C0Q70_07319 [Pomacea canaliculata]|uniref:RING-type domain-containing protein n=1 Tax=Pomacea canaliculata TaxID=400727 RepID=A0A2T7PEP4_POMCA|nr:hypothetical protein C0Q70_07319 [Pomacea canaliculata]
MAASPRVTEELTCSICLELFDHPLLLPCAHTFCRQCLRDFWTRSTGALVGKEGVDGLPKNTTLSNIILSFQEDGQRQKPVPDCDVCDVEPPRVGFKSCSECYLTYCKTCFDQLHPMRGAFLHHVITSPAPSEQRKVIHADTVAQSPRVDSRKVIRRVRSMSPLPKEQEYADRLRRSITAKRKEMRETLKTVQDLLKSTEDETEDQMKQIKALSSRLHEAVAEREGAMLAGCTRRRHEAVTCCYGLISDAQALMLELDLLEEKFGQLLIKAPMVDISQVAIVKSTTLRGRLHEVPRPRPLQTVHVQQVLRDMDFLRETEIPVPVITDILPRPVSKGPAVIEVKWAGPVAGTCYRLTAWRKTQKGRTERLVVDDVTGACHVLLLPGVDVQYHLLAAAIGKKGEGDKPGVAEEVTTYRGEAISEEKVFRTLPYVNCLSLRFDTTYCHKLIAVSSTREEVMHRKCKLANLSDAYPASTCRRLDTLEGAMADTPFPPLPHMYWEVVVHFHVIGRLDDTKLICDFGVCKSGMEDSCGLVCDNHKSYCCYLVRRQRYINLEFWNGPNQEILARALTVADLQRDNEKTLKLGFYLDTPRRLFAVVNPAVAAGSGSVLAQFHVKFANLVFLCGLYCPDQVLATIKHVPVVNIPTIVAKLMRAHSAAAEGAAPR